MPRTTKDGQLTFGSLFAGIGGFDLGFERAGMQCKWQVENDDYAIRILEKHWQEVRRHRDIRTFPDGDPADWRVDCVVGGFPCQDISYAGALAGLDGERSGLFYEAMRVVRVLEPRYVVLENVAALLTRGLDQVLGTLAAIGFDAEWHCIPAAAVGAPHIRDRVFILAYATGITGRAGLCGGEQAGGRRGLTGDCCGKSGEGSDADSGRQERSRRGIQSDFDASFRPDARSVCEEVPDSRCDRLEGQQQAGTASGPVDRPGDGSDSGWWSTVPDVGRVAHGVPKRVDRLRGLGNAVVPQVAEWIGRRIQEVTERQND